MAKERTGEKIESASLGREGEGRTAVGFGEATRFWLKLGFISFGGPAAVAAASLVALWRFDAKIHWVVATAALLGIVRWIGG